MSLVQPVQQEENIKKSSSELVGIKVIRHGKKWEDGSGEKGYLD